MKSCFLAYLATFLIVLPGRAQKPLLDSNILGEWPSVANPLITNDGNYSAYIVISRKGGRVFRILHIVKNASNLIWVFGNVRSFAFTNDSRRMVFLKSADSLGIFDLANARVEYILNVRSFKVPDGGDKDIFGYVDKDGVEVCMNAKVRWVEAGQVKDFAFANNGGKLIVRSCNLIDTMHRDVLTLINLTSGTLKEIWKGQGFAQYFYDEGHNNVFIIGKERDAAGEGYSLYEYRDDVGRTDILVSGDSALFQGKFELGTRYLEISRNGDKVMFEISTKGAGNRLAKVQDENVRVWNYKDFHLQSEQADPGFEGRYSKHVLAVLDLVSHRIIRLNNDEILQRCPGTFEDYSLFAENYPGTFQTTEYKEGIYLISISNGRKRSLTKIKPTDFRSISPDEKYVLWFNSDSLSYFSYEVKSGIIRNLSALIPSKVYNEEADEISKRYLMYGIPAWINKGHAIMIFDRYDIWNVELGNYHQAESVTNGYGAKEKIIFDIVENNDETPIRTVKASGKLLLTGFDPRTKANGFWWAKSGNNPEMCNMNEFAYLIGRTNSVGMSDKADGFIPIKARDADVYIVARRSAKAFPNFYLTKDFKVYQPISDLHPENGFNWLSAELLTWKMSDGRESQGILYKPDDFDSTKRYPVIFDVYEKKSNSLNQYMGPDFTGGSINIPYFVSNGYLVFSPDIYYWPGHKGEGVMNALESAVKCLSRFAWIDSHGIGIEGHSFGGWEVNYVVTHSKKFAAACEVEGPADEISFYDGINWGRNGMQEWFETGGQASPYGFGVTPWKRPDLYIENSPVFFASRVSTPLLVVHGDADGGGPFSQGVEMYMALRRARKKVWLLQYRGADHGLSGVDAKDLTRRMKSFFDFYLRKAPAPEWMTLRAD